VQFEKNQHGKIGAFSDNGVTKQNHSFESLLLENHYALLHYWNYKKRKFINKKVIQEEKCSTEKLTNC